MAHHPPTASGADRLKARKPLPKPVPAYLSSEGSPLAVDKNTYTSIEKAGRVLVEEFTLPIRSGRAWEVPAGHICQISTPEGPQVGTSHNLHIMKPPAQSSFTHCSSGDLNIWNLHNPRERFWASRTKQLHASHLTTHDRLWSNLPYMRPLATILQDTLSWYGADENGGRVHDLLGTRCDPYVNTVLSGGQYDFHCHSNLTRAVAPWGLAESDVHDVINIFQVTGLDEQGRYFMSPCPAEKGDYIEFLAEQDLLMALSKRRFRPNLIEFANNVAGTCPGGDLSLWGFGDDSEQEMIKCCRPLHVKVFKLEDPQLLESNGWKPAEKSQYRGLHGVVSYHGEDRKSRTNLPVSN